jgi:4-amino-4-deoxy-L-arabinose transferase-like glycosyltransferase
VTRGEAAALAGILIVALALRLVGLGFGLPAVYNPDEVAIVSRSLAFAKGDLNPHNFLYPTFYFYALFGWLGAYFAGSWLAGGVSSVTEFQTRFFTDPSGIYFAGRLLTALCGVATVAALFLLARKLFGTRSALCAALFLAVAPIHVRDSHYVKHDVPVTLAIVVAYVALRSLVERGGIVPAAVACGVAFSTHYYAVFLIAPLVVAIIQSRWAAGTVAVLKALALAGLVTASVFFALSPFILVEPLTAWRDITANRAIVIDRAMETQGGAFGSASEYLRMLWQEGVGWPVLVGSLVGGLRLLWRDPKVACFVLAFPVPLFAFICNTVPASRYLNPALPFIAVSAGYAVSEIADRFTMRSMRRAWLTALLAVALALPAAWLSVTLGAFFRQTDTRTLAQRFIESRIPAGSTLLVQPYSVPLVQSRTSLEEALTANLGDPRRASTKFALRLALDPYPAPAYRTIFLGDGGLDADKIYVSYGAVDGSAGLEALHRAGVHYVVLKRYNVEDSAVGPLRRMLAVEAQLMGAFSPYRPDVDAHTRTAVPPFQHNTDTPYDRALERPGPGIEIWRLPSGS